MADHIDREESMKAIRKIIAEEKKTLEGWEKKAADKKQAKQDSSYEEQRARDEKSMISGKERILEIMKTFGQMPQIDAEFEELKGLLKKAKDRLEELRKQQPKPVKDIEELEEKKRALEKFEKGMQKAKDVLVYD